MGGTQENSQDGQRRPEALAWISFDEGKTEGECGFVLQLLPRGKGFSDNPKGQEDRASQKPWGGEHGMPMSVKAKGQMGRPGHATKFHMGKEIGKAGKR